MLVQRGQLAEGCVADMTLVIAFVRVSRKMAAELVQAVESFSACVKKLIQLFQIRLWEKMVFVIVIIILFFLVELTM